MIVPKTTKDTSPQPSLPPEPSQSTKSSSTIALQNLNDAHAANVRKRLETLDMANAVWRGANIHSLLHDRGITKDDLILRLAEDFTLTSQMLEDRGIVSWTLPSRDPRGLSERSY